MELNMLGFKESCQSLTVMIDVSELLLAHEVLQRQEEVRWRQVDGMTDDPANPSPFPNRPRKGANCDEGFVESP
ncbi:hypothetical protein KIN20_006080 [Parelaphostrongylus tenuis]|uniref:Uncharacterized protein n=1 Tax=Parelaphostrongylus tenuis TaxID=148309 RepID=A0AAD5M335_PARTN|nr:hypothetical protein KIN20_006080 [Parelaphostrongylus tenuis]